MPLSNRKEDMKCNICGHLLSKEEWIDDDDYGVVHTRCLSEEKAATGGGQ